MIDFFLEFFVKSSVILTIVILLTYVRHFSAAERHILAFSGLCSLLVLLAFDGFYDWRIADLEGLNLSRSMADVGKEVILLSATATPMADSSTKVDALGDHPFWLITLYLTIGSLLVISAIANYRLLSRKIVNLEEPGYSPDFLRLHFMAPVRFFDPTETQLKTDDCSTPWMWGVGQTYIVLPANFRDWPIARQKEALDHELAHLYRGDCFIHIVSHFLTIVFWFQPLAWILRKRLHHLSELASDDWVLSKGAVAPDYAQTLLDIAKQNNQVSYAGIGMGVHRHPLSDRIESILAPSRRRAKVNFGKLLTLMAAVFVISLPLSAITNSNVRANSLGVIDDYSTYDTAANKLIVKQLLADEILWQDHLTDDVVWNFPNRTIRGREALKAESSKQLQHPGTPIHVSIVGDKNIVAAEFKYVNGIGVDGKPYTNTYCSVYQFTGNKISHVTEYTNTEVLRPAIAK